MNAANTLAAIYAYANIPEEGNYLPERADEKHIQFNPDTIGRVINSIEELASELMNSL